MSANEIQNLNQRFGPGTVTHPGNPPQQGVDVIPLGVPELDEALGIGGLPRGRVVEIFGPEASGKTTLALHVIAEAQRQGGTAAYVEIGGTDERSFDPSYAAKIGVRTDQKLLISQPSNGEQALDITETLARSGAVSVIVLDSVGGLVPQAEIEGEDAHTLLQARLMSQALRRLTAIASRSGCLVIFINRLRQKLGVTFGNGEVTTGGNALKFYASIRIEVRCIDSERRSFRGKIVKNKLAPPFTSGEFEIRPGYGVVPDIETLIHLVRAVAWEDSTDATRDVTDYLRAYRR